MKRIELYLPFGILILGILLRLLFLFHAPGSVDSDYGIIGLMGMDILRGDWPVFFYGQAYMGSLEAIGAALFFLLFGVSCYSLTLSPILFSALFLVTIYFFVKAIYGKVPALCAMAYSALGPLHLISYGVGPKGGYIEILFLGTLVFFLALRIQQQMDSRKKRLFYLCLGLVAGIGWWTHLLIIYYLIPAAFFLLLAEWRHLSFKNILTGGISFFIGSSLFWYHNLTHGLKTTALGGAVTGTNFISALKKMWLNDLPALLGLRIFNCLSWVFCLFWIMAGVVFLMGVLKRFSLRPSRIKGEVIGLFFLVTVTIIFSLSRFALLPTQKYLLPLFTVIPLALAYFCSRRKAILGIGALVAVLGFNVVGNLYIFFKDYPDIKESAGINIELQDFLKEKGITRVLADYWVAYKVSFITKEKTICSEIEDPRHSRYELMVDEADEVGLISCSGGEKEQLNSIGANYLHHKIGPYHIFYSIRNSIPAEGRAISTKLWQAKTNFQPRLVKNAFDRDLEKVWTSIQPKQKGMYFELDLGSVFRIYKICMYNGDHVHNFPAGYCLEISKDGITWEKLQERPSVDLVFWSGPRIYWHQRHGRLELIFSPVNARYIRITQLGSGEIHPWEINEIFVYEPSPCAQGLGEYPGESTEDYQGSMYEAAEFARAQKIEFVYADFWPSAKVRDLTDGNVKTLSPENQRYPERKFTSRNVVITPETAFLIKGEDGPGVEEIFNEFEIEIDKKIFGDYGLYYFSSWNKDYIEEPGLYWLGFGLAKFDSKGRSLRFFRRAQSYEKEGELALAIKYYKKSISYYPNNIAAYKNFVDLCKRLNLEDEHQKYNLELKKRTSPEIPGIIEFEKGIAFLGYSLDKSHYLPGETMEIDYFWKVTGPILEDIFVFVHFIKDKQVVFQNDHPLLQHYMRTLEPLPGEIFREQFQVPIPVELTAGNYSIWIGLWLPQEEMCLKVKQSDFLHKTDRVNLGKIKIKSDE